MRGKLASYRIRPSRGFTLVELLVVIAIIGVLVALLLPAVQAAREAARRMSCSNNVKNVAVAIHNYHDVHKFLPYSIDSGQYGKESYVLPDGTLEPAPPSELKKTGNLCGKGWIVDILPHLEQQAMYDGMKIGWKDPDGRPTLFGAKPNGGRGMGRLELRGYIAQQLPVLKCPSDPSAVIREDLWYWVGIPTAPTSYKGVMGDPAIGFGGLWSTSEWGSFANNTNAFETLSCNGLFFRMTYYEPIPFKAITDGLSNTLMIGETVTEQDLHAAAYFSDGDVASCNMQLNFFITPPDREVIEQRWYDVRGFRSLHPGGVHFAMADASVRFIAEGIDHQLYRALSTRAGDEVVKLE